MTMRIVQVVVALGTVFIPATITAQNCSVIDRLPYSITESGAFCLQKSLSPSRHAPAAIEVLADDVTLDFGGLGISRKAEKVPSVGVLARDIANLRILNGSIRNFTIGIQVNSGKKTSQGIQIQRMTVIGGSDGIFVAGTNLIVRDNHLFGMDRGVVITGDKGIIERNLISGLNLPPLTGPASTGIRLLSLSGLGLTSGFLVSDNRIINADIGVEFVSTSSAITKGKYRGNYTQNVAIHVLGGTDAAKNR